MAPKKQGKKGKAAKGKQLKTVRQVPKVHTETKTRCLVRTLLMSLYKQNFWSQFSNCCNWLRGKHPFLQLTENPTAAASPTNPTTPEDKSTSSIYPISLGPFHDPNFWSQFSNCCNWLKGKRPFLQLTVKTMATANPTMTLEDGTTCSVCLEPFRDPVIIHCGHSFCRACITEYWKEFDMNVCCPICRTCSPEKYLIPNRHLENILENYKELYLHSDAAKGYKNTGSTLERCETKLSWFPAIPDFSDMKEKLKFSQISPVVQHILRKCRGKVSLDPPVQYQTPATIYGAGSDVASACGPEEVIY